MENRNGGIERTGKINDRSSATTREDRGRKREGRERIEDSVLEQSGNKRER